MARVLGNDGAAVLQSNVASINAKMFDIESDPTADLLTNRVLTVASVIFDALQASDARWTVDTTGYNFLYVLPAEDLPDPTTYRVEVTITPSSGGVFPIVYELPVHQLLGS